MTETESVAVDLPEEAFPFTMMLVNHDTGEVLMEHEIASPGALYVPGLDQTKAKHVDSVVITKDSTGEMMTHDNSYYEWTLP